MIKNRFVYHYTSIDVLRCLMESVMKSRNHDSYRFYASNILYMNDPNEFVYGSKVFLRTLKQIEAELEIVGSQRMSLLWNELTKGNKDYISYMQESNELPYVVSFSGLEDSLPMWLNYGDRGKGVCLAFRIDKYISENHSYNRIFSPISFLSKVSYNTIKKKSDLYITLFQIMQTYKEDILDGRYDDNKEIYFNTLIQYAAPLIKTKFYQNEQEIRLIQTIKYNYQDDISKVEFRCNAKGNIISYIPIVINIKYLEYVIIGPCADYGLTKKAIEMMKTKYDLEFGIKKSNVQYRDY